MVLHKTLHLCAYKIQLHQEVKPKDRMAQKNFAETTLAKTDA